MHTWSKYKNFLFTTLCGNGKDEVRVVYQTDTKKSFFCFDDFMGALNYKKDEHGSMNSDIARRYSTRINFFNFIELFPTAVFVPVDKLKNLPSQVTALSRVDTHHTAMLAVITSTLKAFTPALLNRQEVVISENVESFVEVYTKQFSIATYDNRVVVKATDVIRYCGYKKVKVKDNIKEHSVKIKTKAGVTNFIFLESFPIIADEMTTDAYAKRMISLYNGISRLMPNKNDKVVLDREKSVAIIGSTVIPFVIEDDKVMFQTSTVQRVCGYKCEGVMDNFKRVSGKVGDFYYMTVSGMKELIETRMTAEYKVNVKNLVNSLHKFA